jgi:hypothetical protein
MNKPWTIFNVCSAFRGPSASRWRGFLASPSLPRGTLSHQRRSVHSMRHPLLSAIAAAGSTVLLLSACGDSVEPPVPTTVQIDSASLSFSSIGETRQLTAAVKDQRGDPFGSPEIAWSVANPSVATVDSVGIVTAVGAGITQVTVTDEAAAASIDVEVVQVPTQVQKISGDGQSGPPGLEFPGPLTVQVSDARGHPIPGVAVGFTVTSGTGSIATPFGTSGADGRVSTRITAANLGSVQVRAGVDNNIGTVFTMTAVSQFNIEVRFLTTPSESQRQAFSDAERRWESLIVGDIPNVLLNVAAGSCGTGSPAFNETIDDVVILVSLVQIDGPGEILGAAGPCFIRSGDGLSILGLMRLDTEDLDLLDVEGILGDVILHEMGHVLGIGTLWDTMGLLEDATSSGGTDPHFTGTGALAAFNAAGGTAFTASAKVPVENTGGLGTADAHWRESVFDTELMTGFISFGENPLSAVTVESLADEGYLVNALGADAYSLVPAPTLRAGPLGPAISLTNDVLKMPIGVVGEGGRIEEFVRPK